MVEIFNLRIYLKDGPNLFFIDESFSRDRKELELEAEDRKRNNSDYICIILSLKTFDAILH